jgi:hypothetical protein
MLDLWVCGRCHSINRERADRCYKCHAPRSESTPDTAGRREERAIVARIEHPVHSGLPLAIVAAVLIVIVIGLGLWTTGLELEALPQMRALFDQAAAGASVERGTFDAIMAPQDALTIPTLAAAGLALLAFAAWLAVGVANIPGLGGGTPSASPAWAFVSTLIPLLNLVRVPRILQEVLYRSDPRGGGVLLLALAWVGLIGSWIVARLAIVYIDTRLVTDLINSRTVAEYARSTRPLLDLAVVVDVATSAMVTIGAAALVATMAVVERRTAIRNREINGRLGPR